MAAKQQTYGLPAAFYDTRYAGWYTLDLELLRLGILGSKRLLDISVSSTIAAGSTSSPVIDLWKSDNIAVIKRIEVSGVEPSSVDLTVDGITFTVTPGDLEATYGSKIYGTLIQAKVNVATAPTAETSITVRALGYEAGKAQVPMG